MKITDEMIVSDDVENDALGDLYCYHCCRDSLFTVQTIFVFRDGEVIRMRLWGCQIHPLPSTITDDSEVEE